MLLADATGRPEQIATEGLFEAVRDVRVLVQEPDVGDPLAARGATLVRGRCDQLDHVESALADVDALLARPGWDDARSVLERGRTLARAAERADVGHTVFTSIGNADAEPGVPAVDAAAAVEDELRDRSVPSTIVRTHLPMRRLERRRRAVRDRGDLTLPLEWGVRATWTDATDVGRLAARALADAEAAAGETYELVGSRLALPDVAETIAAVTGWDVGYTYGGVDAAPRDRSAFYRWVDEGGLGADVGAGVDVAGFDATTLRAYLIRSGWGREDE